MLIKAIGLFFCASVFTSFSVMSADNTNFNLKAECTTDATGGDGVRHSCESDIQTYNAPSGYAIVKDKVVAAEDSGNGDEHSCNLGFSNDVEVVKDTGIMQPRTMTMQAKARGPSGYFTGRGWAKCSYSGYITKY